MRVIILLIFFVFIIVALLGALIFLGPQIGLPQIQITVVPDEPVEKEPQLPADMQRYYDLKNVSCGTLSNNFLISTHDVANGSLSGIIANQAELEVAASIVRGFDYEQDTKTYVLGDQMKKVIQSDDTETITIWKGGRIYECEDKCTMKLMEGNLSDEYYNSLNAMRNNCNHFGKTRFPDSVNLTKLLNIKKTGVSTINGYRCDNFEISGNKTYISTLNLTGDAKDLAWMLDHLDGPVQECLDESTGIIVKRNLTLDLTDSYNLKFEEDGYIKVNQVTELTYFTDTVPESFLALPE